MLVFSLVPRLHPYPHAKHMYTCMCITTSVYMWGYRAYIIYFYNNIHKHIIHVHMISNEAHSRWHHILVECNGFLEALFTLVHVASEQAEHTVVIPQLRNVVLLNNPLLIHVYSYRRIIIKPCISIMSSYKLRLQHLEFLVVMNGLLPNLDILYVYIQLQIMQDFSRIPLLLTP